MGGSNRRDNNKIIANRNNKKALVVKVKENCVSIKIAYGIYLCLIIGDEVSDMIKVKRNLYFLTKENGYLRYSESSPEEKECEHHVCNCTKAVSEKPDGEPKQNQQYIEFFKDNKFKVGLSADGCQFTLRLPGNTWLAWGKEGKSTSSNHAYFWFKKNYALYIEITKEGYNETNCFFGHMYFGNKVDISSFFNGHSPSRIVNLEKVGSEELWMHYCSFGSEKVISLRECEETTLWREMFVTQEKITKIARTYEEDYISSVEDIRQTVSKEVEMLDMVNDLCDWFDIVVKNIDKTEMFSCGSYCCK